MKRRLSPSVLALLSCAVLTSGCPSAAPPGQVGAQSGATGGEALPPYMAVFTLGVRTADSGMQVYNRLHKTTPAARLALLDMHEDEEELDEETEEDEEEWEIEIVLEEEWDEEEFEDFEISAEDEVYLDLDEDEVLELIELAEFEELEDEEEAQPGDRALKQRIAVTRDDISGDTGALDVREVVSTEGHVRKGAISYTPDEPAKLAGHAPQTIRYDVPADQEKTGNVVDVTVTGGAGNTGEQTLSWGSTTARFTEKVLPSGAVTMNGTVTTDTGLELKLTGQAKPTGERDLTVTGGGYAIVFKDVKDIRRARGVVLDKAPDQADANVLAYIEVQEAAPTVFSRLSTPVPYASVKATAFQQPAAFRLSEKALQPLVSDMRFQLGREDAQGMVPVTSRMTVALGGESHAVAIDGENMSYMSEKADAFHVTDMATGNKLSFALEQESAGFTVSNAAGSIAVVEHVDGTLSVAGRRAGSAREAGEILAATPVGRAVSLHALTGFNATLANLPAEATRSTCPHHGSYRTLYYCPPTNTEYKPGYRVLQQGILEAWLTARQGR